MSNLVIDPSEEWPSLKTQTKSYLDSVKLVAVDHPSNVDVYSTRGTYLNNLAGQGTIYTVSKSLFTPASAVNNGEDVLSQISKQDGNYTVAQRWTWNTLDLNLGNLTGAQQINLLVTAVIAWPTNQAGGDWAAQFASQPGVTPSPPPYMEVKDQNGNWIALPNNREFPMPPVNPTPSSSTSQVYSPQTTTPLEFDTTKT